MLFGSGIAASHVQSKFNGPNRLDLLLWRLTCHLPPGPGRTSGGHSELGEAAGRREVLDGTMSP